RRMDAVCRQRGVALAVVHLPDGTQAPVLQNLDLEPPSGGLHDLRQRIPYAEVRFRYDFHPTPEGHGILAEHLEPIVTVALGLPRARTSGTPGAVGHPTTLSETAWERTGD
ncbi:MAG: hypothetical protein ABFS46_05825, partial [Myxococcota bacterium]